MFRKTFKSKRGEQANHKKSFLEAGKPKVSEEGLIDIAAELNTVNTNASNTYGIEKISSKSKDDSPLLSPK